VIHVWVERNNLRRIIEVTIDGHADFADRGYDIVCAAVSALSIGTVNSAEVLLGVALAPAEENEEGFLWIQTPASLENETDDKLQLLLESLSLSLKGIADQYPDHVRYDEGFSKEIHD
jgi:uncharacterized protein YsxB (DUF464 family)